MGVSENVDHFQRCSKPNGRAAGGKLFVLSKVPGRGPLYSTGNCTSSGSGTCAWRRAQSSACAGQPSARRGGVRGGGLGPRVTPHAPSASKHALSQEKETSRPVPERVGRAPRTCCPALLKPACGEERTSLAAAVSRSASPVQAVTRQRPAIRGTSRGARQCHCPAGAQDKKCCLTNRSCLDCSNIVLVP